MELLGEWLVRAIFDGIILEGVRRLLDKKKSVDYYDEYSCPHCGESFCLED